MLYFCVQLGDSDSDESDWSMSSESSSSSSEDEEGKGIFRYTAEYFLKKSVIVVVVMRLVLLAIPLPSFFAQKKR